MLLATDIGNTNIVVGLYEGNELKDHFRISSRQKMTTDEAGFFVTGWLQRMKIENKAVDSFILASVVPPLTGVFESMARKHFGCIPIVVSPDLNLPITIEIDRKEQLGADRICNAVAGFDKQGGPIIIVDFGTATTFDVISAEGSYIGGVIIPGPETSMAELARKAARLFEVRIEPPESVIGKSTAAALRSGLFHGTVGQVDYIIDKIIDEAGFENTRIIATGGLAAGLENYSRFIRQVEPTLTLEGLRLIEAVNREG